MEEFIESVELRIALDSGLSNCARCGDTHDQLNWKQMERPMPRQGGGSYPFWALCPSTGDPILMAVIPV